MIERDRLESICRRCVSVISKTHRNRRYLFYTFLLFFFVFLLLLPELFHHDTSHHKHRHEMMGSVHYRHALAENLERLNELGSHPIKQNSKPIIAEQKTHFHRTHSKSDQLRQNAPTRLYNADLPPSAKSRSQQATLLDKSSYAHFTNQTSSVPVILASRMAHPFYTIPQGEFIHANLETAIDSDLPGMIRAVIARPVYSYRGDHLLIPEGSRLIGQYSSQTLQGINRVMVIWQRIILPNGVSVQIDSPGSDEIGEGGFAADTVNRHFLQRFGQASLLSVIGAVVSNNNPTAQYQTAIAQSFQSSANRVLEHSIAIKPTLRVNQGDHVIVFVARDLDFYTTARLL